MTNATQSKPISTPVLLVYGKPTGPDLPQASWFRAEDRTTVVAAAQNLKFAVLYIAADTEKAITLGVDEGVLKGNGRMVVGSVSPEVYKRIEDFAAKAPPASAAALSAGVPGAKSGLEQNTNIPVRGETGSALATGGKTISASPTQAWEKVKQGDRILAAYWNESREFAGFWLATVKRVEKGEFTLEWLDAPEYPPFKGRPKNIAVPHPEFRISGK